MVVLGFRGVPGGFSPFDVASNKISLLRSPIKPQLKLCQSLRHPPLLFRFTIILLSSCGDRPQVTCFLGSLTLLLCPWKFNQRLLRRQLHSQPFTNLDFLQNSIVLVVTFVTPYYLRQPAVAFTLREHLYGALTHRETAASSSVPTGFRRQTLCFVVTVPVY